MLLDIWGKWETLFTLGTENWWSHSGGQSGKISMCIPSHPAILLQGMYPEESVSGGHKGTDTRAFSLSHESKQLEMTWAAFLIEMDEGVYVHSRDLSSSRD